MARPEDDATPAVALLLAIVAAVLLTVVWIVGHPPVSDDPLLVKPPRGKKPGPPSVKVVPPTKTPLPLPHQDREWFRERKHQVS
jgi:hypothetical protein